jgi:hypothetical protein
LRGSKTVPFAIFSRLINAPWSGGLYRSRYSFGSRNSTAFDFQTSGFNEQIAQLNHPGIIRTAEEKDKGAILAPPTPEVKVGSIGMAFAPGANGAIGPEDLEILQKMEFLWEDRNKQEEAG